MSSATNFAAYNYDEIMHQEIMKKALRLEKTHQIQCRKSSWVNRFMAILMIALVFGSMAFLLIRYAEINEVKYRNFELKQEIESLNIQVEELQLKIESAMSLKNIETYAEEKLGMQHPAEEQIVYLPVGTKYVLNELEKTGNMGDNETVVVENVAVEPQGFLAMIVDTFRN